MNGTKHRMLAKSVLLRCEDPERFLTFAESFHREYRPRTATEITLVNMMTSARWRLMRMSHVEAVNIDAEYARQVEPAVVPADFGAADRAGLAYRDASRNSRVLDVVIRMEGRLQRQFDSSLDRLMRLRETGPDVALQDSAELEPPEEQNGL
jgi:hypothetical protein